MLTYSLYIFHIISLARAVHHQKHFEHSTFGIRPKLIERGEFQKDDLLESGRYARETVEVPDYIKMTELKDNDHNQALIHWTGYAGDVPSSSIFILTRHKSGQEIIRSSFWRSTDYGISWANENDKFHDDRTGNTNVLHSFVISGLDKKKVIFLESEHGRVSTTTPLRLWVSHDEGASFTSYDLPSQVVMEEIKFHPTEVMWMLGYDRKARTVWFSNDFGITWSKIASKVTPDRYFWYEPEIDIAQHGDFTGSDDFGEKNVSRLVHFELESEPVKIDLMENGALFEMKSCLVPTCTTAGKQYDRLNSFTQKHAIAESSLMIRDNFIFFEKSHGAVNRLYVSYKRGNFTAAEFPDGVQQISYHVISSDQGFVMMAVNHENGVSQLFSSSNDGGTYRLVLENIRYFQRKRNNLSLDTIYSADVHDVKGLSGCFLANQHSLQTSEQVETNKTLITWDSGKTWQYLAMPDVEKKSTSGETLNLHLEKTLTDIGFFAPSTLTKDSSPGYIIAHGAVAKTIQERPEQLNLYISTDGGKNWRETKPSGLQGRFVTTFLDSGAITIVIQMNPYTPRKTLHFSTTEGRDWKPIQFSHELISVDAILTEPGELTKIVTIFGHVTWTKPWQIYTVNLTTLAQACTQTDYQNWTYADCSDNSETTIGMEMKFMRRKVDASCYNGADFKRSIFNHSCEQCSIKDYFCQSGSVVTEDKRCKNVDRSSSASSPYMIKKSNLRPIKAPGNQCVKEYNWARPKKSFPGRNHNGTASQLNLKIVGTTSSIFAIPATIMIQAENAENIDSFSWTVHEQNGSAIVQTKGPFKTATGMYSLRMSTVGTSKITVLGGGQSDFIVVSGRIGMAHSKLYCPPYTKPNLQNRLIVHSTDQVHGRWMSTYEPKSIGSPKYEWWGDLTQPATSQSTMNITFGEDSKADLTILVTVVTQLGQNQTTCHMNLQRDIEVIQLRLSDNDHLYADSDDDVTIIQSIFKGIVGRMPGFNEIMTKYELEMDEDIVFYPIPTRVITTVLIFLVPSKENQFDAAIVRGELSDMMVKSVSDVTNVIRNDNGTTTIESIGYAQSSGLFVELIQPSSAGRTVGIFILIAISAALLCFAGKWLYKQHQEHRYSHSLLVSDQHDDREAIIDQDEIAQNSTEYD